MANEQNGSVAPIPPQEKKHGHLVEQQVHDALRAAGAEIRDAESTEEERRRDHDRKVDILITRIPGITYPDRVIALQVTTDARIGRKQPKFMYESNVVADRKVYLRVSDTYNTTIDREFGDALLTIIKAWLRNTRSSAHRAVAITLFKDLTYNIFSLADLIAEHAARVAATEGERLAGSVKSFIPERGFGFVDCDDARLVDSDEAQGDFQFFFRASDCSPEILERLNGGEESVKVFFRNDGYDHNRPSDEAPHARKLETYVAPANRLFVAGPQPEPEALRNWMQSVYDTLEYKTAVMPPPALSSEQWDILQKFGYYLLWLPEVDKDAPLPNGFTNIKNWTRGPIRGRWVAVETIKPYADTRTGQALLVGTVGSASSGVLFPEPRESAQDQADDAESSPSGFKNRYSDDRLAQAIGLTTRLGVSTDQLYGVYLNRIAEALGVGKLKVQILSAEEWIFIAGLLNWIRENYRENLVNLFVPTGVLELVRNTDPAAPGLKAAIGSVKAPARRENGCEGFPRTTLSFTRIESYTANARVAFRTLIEFE